MPYATFTIEKLAADRWEGLYEVNGLTEYRAGPLRTASLEEALVEIREVYYRLVPGEAPVVAEPDAAAGAPEVSVASLAGPQVRVPSYPTQYQGRSYPASPKRR